MSLVSLKNVSFSYGDIDILKEISFTVNQGEVLCLLGPNGCGKTTLLDCIMGIKRINQGKIIIDEKDINTMKPHEIAKQIAFVPQTHEKTFPYRVIDFILTGRAAYTSIFSSPTDEDIYIAEKALKMVGMLDFKDRIYTRLSGGELQLVLIARALVQQTPIIVMDEPTTHLDLKHQLKIMETIVSLTRKKKLTIIMATHFPNHAFYFDNNSVNTSIVMLNDLKIAAAGKPAEVLSVEKIEEVFNIAAKRLSYTGNDRMVLSHIIPLNTLKNRRR